MKFYYDDNTKRIKIVESTKIEYNQVKIWLERYVENYKFMPKFKFTSWDGKVKLFDDGNIKVGLWKECVKALQVIGSNFEVVNREEFPLNRGIDPEHVKKFVKDFFSDHYKIDKDTGEKIDFMPYDYQVETAIAILKNRYCTAEVATSGGKSLIISIVFFYLLKYHRKSIKLLIIVPSIDLVTQFYDDIHEYNYGKYKENKNPIDIKIQEIMSAKPRQWHGEGEPNIYISTYQSLAKIENFGDEFYRSFYAIVSDEAHQAKSTSLVNILTETMDTAYYRFGVSGTFQDDGTADYLTIQSVTGPKVKSIRAKKLQDEGKITNVRIVQLILNHDDGEIQKRLNDIRKNRNKVTLAYQVESMYVRRSKKRKEFLIKLISKISSNTLILFNIIEFGKDLLDGLKETYESIRIIKDGEELPPIEFLYIDGSVNKKQRNEIKKLMETNDDVIRVLVATYGTLSTGVSINNLHNVIFAESFKKEQRIIQSIGRVLRLHKDKSIASVFDLVDVFDYNDPRNAYYRHGGERRRLYNKHEYPFTVKKFNL